MEIVLNLLWLMLALASVCLWTSHWRKRLIAGARWSELLRSAVGLTCVLLFMFFAISLSDDLYEMTILVEDPPASRLRASRVGVPDNHAPQPPVAVLPSFSSVVAIPARAAFRTISVPALTSPRMVLSGPVALRAPPSCS